MKKRIIQLILIVPCVIFDLLQVIFIILPYWLVFGDNDKFQSKTIELFND